MYTAASLALMSLGSYEYDQKMQALLAGMLQSALQCPSVPEGVLIEGSTVQCTLLIAFRPVIFPQTRHCWGISGLYTGSLHFLGSTDL